MLSPNSIKILFGQKTMICFNLKSNVFIRHVDDRTVVWEPRTGGCTVFVNARPIIEEIEKNFCEEGDIIKSVAEKFECDVTDISDGVNDVIKELVEQRFLEVVDDGEMCEGLVNYQQEGIYTISVPLESEHYKDDDRTPLCDFYLRHNLPMELHIDLTDGCNEKCVHCYLPKGGTHYLNKDIAFKVLKEFREAQGLTVLVSGGECMLHRDFAEILRYAKSLDLNIIVLSNLILCDDRMVALLKEIDPQFVNVSLYAVTESVHDSITQIPGSCKKTKAAIDALQAAGVHVRIATPFMRENKSCVEELKEYAAARHVHLVADSEIFGQIDQSCTNQRHALSMQELELLLSSYKDVFGKARFEPEKCLCDAKVCDIGEGRLNLDAEGKYYPCDGFHGAIIGDAQKESLWDVWNGAALNRLRSLTNRDFGSCASCADRAWCKVCPMRNYNETGNMLAHAPWRCEAARLYRKIFEEK